MQHIPSQIKELLKSDSVKKNFRISFPNGERDDIINDNLIQESVSFTESVCSQNTLKFGLSESSTLSFQTVGVENIKGYVIDAEIEIDMSNIEVEEPTADARTLDFDNNSVSFTIHPGQYIMIASDEEVSYSYNLAMADASGVGIGEGGTWSITNKLISFPSYIESTGLELVTITLTLTLLNTVSGATATVTKYGGDCQSLIGMVDYNSDNSLSFDLEEGQAFKWVCDESPAVLGTIAGYDINGKLRITQSNYAFQTSLSSTYTMEDIRTILNLDYISYAKITLSLETMTSYPETQLDVYKIDNAYDYSTTSTDLDYPYYPIPYGRFKVDSCKRSGEYEQRQVECYSYPEIGFSELYEKTMALYCSADETYTVSQPSVLMASYLYSNNLPSKYISSTTDIEYEDSSMNDYADYRLYKENTSGYLLLSFAGDASKHYDFSEVTSTSNQLLHYSIKKVDNYDTILENAVNEVMEIYESEGFSDYVRQNGYQRYRSDEEAIRMLIADRMRPVINGKFESLNKHGYLKANPEDQLLYVQNSTITFNSTDYTWYPNSDAYDITSLTLTVQKKPNGTAHSITVEQLYEIESIQIIQLTSGFVDLYDDWTITVDSTDSGTITLGDYSATVYTFGDISGLSEYLDDLIVLNASFYRYGRDASYIDAMNDDVSETIDSSLYTSLWYDDETVPAIDGAVFSYTQGDVKTSQTGDEPLYDLTDNKALLTLNYADDVVDVLNSSFFPNAIYSEYVPYNLTCVGLPYLEAGDYITVQDKEENEFNTYIMRQTISGIQHLTSSMEAQSVDV